jgi:hypothetical protein
MADQNDNTITPQGGDNADLGATPDPRYASADGQDNRSSQDLSGSSSGGLDQGGGSTGGADQGGGSFTGGQGGGQQQQQQSQGADQSFTGAAGDPAEGGRDQGLGGQGQQRLNGDMGDDALTGHTGDDALDGPGADHVGKPGGPGSDSLQGGEAGRSGQSGIGQAAEGAGESRSFSGGTAGGQARADDDDQSDLTRGIEGVGDAALGKGSPF